MKFIITSAFISISSLLSVSGLAASIVDRNVAMPEGAVRANGVMLAKGGKPAGKARERRISNEREVRTTTGSASTNIDFDAVDIAGERKTPLGSLVNQSKSDMNYDFVKIRLRWHPEMVQSAASLESGSTSK